MLEAFKASADEALAAKQAAEVQARSAGGPFAETPAPPAPPPAAAAPAEAAAAYPAEPAGAPEASKERLLLPVGNLSFLAMQVFLLLAAFFLGRFSTGSVNASAPDESTSREGGFEVPRIDPGASRNLTRPITGQPQAGGAQNLTPMDEAFLDPENRYTIRTISYGRSPMEEDLAFKAYDHMRTEGLPVVTPLGFGEHLMIFVGAAPTRPEIDDLLKEVKSTRGPASDPGAFRSAYVVNIEDYR